VLVEGITDHLFQVLQPLGHGGMMVLGLAPHPLMGGLLLVQTVKLLLNAAMKFFHHTGMRRLNLFGVLLERLTDHFLEVVQPLAEGGVVGLAGFRLTGQFRMG